MSDFSFSLNPGVIPLNLWITTNDYPTTGKTPTVTIRNPEQSGYYLDFSDNKFKNAGWVTQYQNLSSAIDGLYNYNWNTNGVFTSNTTIEAIYFNTGGTTTTAQVAVDTIRAYNYSIFTGGGGGNTTIKGVWTKAEKEKLFNKLDSILEAVSKIVEESSEELKDKFESCLGEIGKIKDEILEKENFENEVLDELGQIDRQI
jgi:hypothetical protein